MMEICSAKDTIAILEQLLKMADKCKTKEDVVWEIKHSINCINEKTIYNIYPEE